MEAEPGEFQMTMEHSSMRECIATSGCQVDSAAAEQNSVGTKGQT